MPIEIAVVQSGFPDLSMDSSEFKKWIRGAGWMPRRRFQKRAGKYEGGYMTSIIFYRDNFRKFVEDAADGQVHLRSRSEDLAAYTGTAEPEGSGTAWQSFLWIHCEGRKGVDTHSTVPKKTVENIEKWRR